MWHSTDCVGIVQPAMIWIGSRARTSYTLAGHVHASGGAPLGQLSLVSALLPCQALLQADCQLNRQQAGLGAASSPTELVKPLPA